MNFKKLQKLRKGDKVAIVSPSLAAPGIWPEVYELGLSRLRDIFGLVPVEFPATKKVGASGEERSADLQAAFKDPEIKAVIASLGGDDQITYVYKMPKDVFSDNPKPFFGFSDNTQFINFLWSCGIPSYYGANLFTEFALTGTMDDFSVSYIKKALFETGEFELSASTEFSDEDLSWFDPTLLTQRRRYQPNEGWLWDAKANAEGILWGGCLESVDEMLRHGVSIPSLEEFENIVLAVETSEEMPSPDMVMRIFRALGERGVLQRIKGLLVGRPKTWSFEVQNTDEQKIAFKEKQREIILATTRKYNDEITIVQNLDIGHTTPQIQLAMGQMVKIDAQNKKIMMQY